MGAPAVKTSGSGDDPAVALCRSILYEAVSLGFGPSPRRVLERLGSEDGAAALAEAATVLDGEGGEGLASRVRAVVACAAAASPESLAAAYERLFGHTVRGPVPPYETEYGEEALFQKPHDISDIAGFLRAFGLALGTHTRERPDHVAYELEFLAFLARKEAHAIETGDGAMLVVTRSATRSFLKDHLGRFVPSFARRVMLRDAGGFYGKLAELSLGLVKLDCARLDTPLGPHTLRLRLPVDDGAPTACAEEESCIPGPAACGAEAADGAGRPRSGLLQVMDPREREESP